jgi:murein DD-endopeptidase MepM/ murein hydrolase activator NlpD
MLKPPLKKMKVTQPFGVDWVGGGFYAKYGMDGHNGLDFSCATGTALYAPCDGTAQVEPDRNGYGNTVRIWTEYGDGSKREVVLGHMKSFSVKNGEKVKAGKRIGSTGNTGASTGPHLHLGVRFWNGAGVLNYGNGYFGYVDPKPMFDPDVWKLPVDRKYGEERMNMTWLQWQKANAHFWATQGRLMSPRERNALVYGYWDLRSVLDPAMFTTWTEMTKPAFLKR